MYRSILAGVSFAALTATGAASQTEIQWWHAMGGELGTILEGIVSDYNDSQDAYRVVPSYRGNYTETMTGAIAAFRAGEQPALVQVFEVGTGTMMSASGAIRPVYQLMENYADGFDPDAFLPAVVSTSGRIHREPLRLLYILADRNS